MLIFSDNWSRIFIMRNKVTAIVLCICFLFCTEGCAKREKSVDSESFSSETSALSSENANAAVSETSSSASDERNAESDKNIADKSNSSVAKNSNTKKVSSGSSTKSTSASSVNGKKPKSSFFKGIWVSCFEMSFKGLDAKGCSNKINSMFAKLAKQGYTAVFCHVRPYADAYYPSKYFPYSRYLTGTEGVNPGYDPLYLMINAAHSNNMEFHAWINPYRVSTSTSDPSKLSANNIAAKWLTDSSNRAIAYNGGIYFNPASTDVQKLVINGVREILQNYKVDGIHFDDYFYPTVSQDFDKKSYSDYCKSVRGTPMNLGDWRRANVNSLVSAVYNVCRQYKKTFGISPSAHISKNHTDRNYNEAYADIALWMREKGYVDYIIPQLYFSYDYPNKNYCYDTFLNLWCSMPKHSGLKLYIGLGAYKLGDKSLKDSAAWCNETGNLLARQASGAKKNGTDGIVVFSYSSSVKDDPLNVKSITNMFKAIG